MGDYSIGLLAQTPKPPFSELILLKIQAFLHKKIEAHNNLT